MTRKEFTKICGILGVGIPLKASLLSCDDASDIEPYKGKVIIIGAGAGGLAAGYLLQQQGIDFEILEASALLGGRMKIDTDFADFPIPMGAEWLETNTSIFKEIVNDSAVQVNIETIRDAPDRKFVNSSWYSFYEEYIIPSIADKISINTVVNAIDYSGDDVIITTQNGEFTANKVVVSVPLKILQDGDITFTPTLPQDKTKAIKNTIVWEGFKAFIAFSTNFYEDEYSFDINPKSDGEKIYYNAALGQNTAKHILGLFVVGKPALAYTSLSDSDLKSFLLNELDSIYANQATPNYIKHISQNWDKEPFIRSGYVTDNADWRMVRELGKSVGNKVYFAGGAYTDGDDWVSVHAAAQSAKRSFDEIVS
ncbi:MAG: monoamine oxidase [Arcticibacterium sp.]|jgi:monoamine oxidase